MTDAFFQQPILNSPYEPPGRHWELDEAGQPTQRIVETRRKADLITPVPKPKKRKKKHDDQEEMVFDEGRSLSTKDQQYDPTPIINEMRGHVSTWRGLPQSSWGVTPETARLLHHWRNHDFSGIRPFFCQVEAVTSRGQDRNIEAGVLVADPSFARRLERQLLSLVTGGLVLEWRG